MEMMLFVEALSASGNIQILSKFAHFRWEFKNDRHRISCEHTELRMNAITWVFKEVKGLQLFVRTNQAEPLPDIRKVSIIDWTIYGITDTVLNEIHFTRA